MFEQLAPARFAHQASYSAKMSPQEIAQLKRQTRIMKCGSFTTGDRLQ